LTSIGEDFAKAVADKDTGAFDRLLAADVDFKALTPGRIWEATGPGGVASVFFDNWFEPGDTRRSATPPRRTSRLSRRRSWPRGSR
jgi:hypothetical protein